MKHVTCSNIVAVLVLVVVFVNVSCRPDTRCRELMETGMVCTSTQAWDSLTVIGKGKTEALYANSKNLTKITLPLRQDIETTDYILTYHQLNDTLSIRHSNTQQFVSVECGCASLHDILSVQTTHHWIDSIAIVETSINRTGATNIQIFCKQQ